MSEIGQVVADHETCISGGLFVWGTSVLPRIPEVLHLLKSTTYEDPAIMGGSVIFLCLSGQAARDRLSSTP